MLVPDEPSSENVWNVIQRSLYTQKTEGRQWNSDEQL
jgi:hypothetical protein